MSESGYLSELATLVTDPAGVPNVCGKVARYDGNARNQLLHEWGDTTYPGEYVYDDSGRPAPLGLAHPTCQSMLPVALPPAI